MPGASSTRAEGSGEVLPRAVSSSVPWSPAGPCPLPAQASVFLRHLLVHIQAAGDRAGRSLIAAHSPVLKIPSGSAIALLDWAAPQTSIHLAVISP